MLIRRGLELVTEAYRAATGLPISEEELLRCGERVYTTEKLLNLREGLGRESDYPPERFFCEAMPDGPDKGAHLDRGDYERLLSDYYQARGWDPASGRPTAEKLRELGLGQSGR